MPKTSCQIGNIRILKPKKIFLNNNYMRLHMNQKEKFQPRSGILSLLRLSSWLCFFLAFSTPVFAVDGTWNVDSNGDWDTTGNWTASTVANGDAATADFSTVDITADRTVTFTSNVTVGTLHSGDASGSRNWIFEGSSHDFTLQNGGATPIITVDNGTTTILTPLLKGTEGLTKQGAGTFALETDGGFNGDVTVEAGILELSKNAFDSNTGSITVEDGATLLVGSGWSGDFENTNDIFINGNGDGTIGAIFGQENQALSGTITLLSDSKIVHGYSNFTFNGPVVANNFNLEVRKQVSNADTNFNGGITLGTGSLTLGTDYGTGTRLITLPGNNVYSGNTWINSGNILFNGSFSSANITLAATSVLYGTGTITYRHGDTIRCLSGSILDNTVKLDLTQVSGKTSWNLISYEAGTFTPPSNLDDLLTTASYDAGYRLQDTGSAITLKPTGFMFQIK